MSKSADQPENTCDNGHEEGDVPQQTENAKGEVEDHPKQKKAYCQPEKCCNHTNPPHKPVLP